MLILMLEICMVTVIVKVHAYCWKYHPWIISITFSESLHVGMRVYMSLNVYILPTLKLILFKQC